MQQSKLRRSATAAALSGVASACYLGTYTGAFQLIVARLAPMRQMFRDAAEGSESINQATPEFQRSFYISQRLDGLVTVPDIENGLIGYAVLWLVLSIGLFATHAAASRLVGALASRRDRFEGLGLGTDVHERLQWRALSFGLLTWSTPICILAGLLTVVWYFGSLASNSLVRTSSAFPTPANLAFAVALFAVLDTLLTASWFARRLSLESADEGIFCAHCRYQIGSSAIDRCPECGSPVRPGLRLPIPVISSMTFTRLGRLALLGIAAVVVGGGVLIAADPGNLWTRIAARSLMQNPAAKSRLVFLLPSDAILTVESPTARAAMLAAPLPGDGVELRVLLWTRTEPSRPWSAPVRSTTSYASRADALRGGEFLTAPQMRLGYSGGLAGIGLIYALPDVGSARFAPGSSAEPAYDWLRSGVAVTAPLSLRKAAIDGR